jgi:Protein of unknown function (DUF3102)
MTAILEAKDGRLPSVRGAQTKVGSGATPATKVVPGWSLDDLHALRGSNRDRKPETTRAAPSPTVAAIPREAGPATFDYASLEPGVADFLRRRVHRIREAVKSTMAAVRDIGVNLCGAKRMLAHGQFVQWVESEFRFSLRSAENYIRASVFADDKGATVANLSPTVVYLLSAKNAPPEVVSDVLARAANGELVSCAEVKGMFRAAKATKRPAGKQTQNESRRAGVRHEGSSPANDETARANARALMKQFGRDGAVVLLGMRENILETLSFLEREIDNSDGPEKGTRA